MKLSKLLLRVATAVALSAIVFPAAATVVYNLDQTAVGAFSPSPFGSVTLDESIANQVTVRVDLFHGNRFVDTGSHHAFGFTLKTAEYEVEDVTVGFTWLEAPFAQSGFGTFGDGIECTACGNGASSPVSAPLIFTVKGVGLTADRFVASTTGNSNAGKLGKGHKSDGGSTGYLFTADIFGSGATGPIASGSTPVPGTPEPDPPASVPEPESYALALVGLAALGVASRRRKAAAGQFSG